MRYNFNQTTFDFPEHFGGNGTEITSGEFFAGGGGWTEGMKQTPGFRTKWILNHDKVALKTNAFHHPDVKVYWADIYAQDEHELEYVDHIHASVECTQHSKAKGKKKKRIGSYTMGWELYRYLKYLLPLVITIENVAEFVKWAPVDEHDEPIEEKEGEEFERWKNAIMALGYEYLDSVRNAANDGLPTSRTRYFAIFHRPGIKASFPAATHSKSGANGKEKWQPCGQHIDLENHGESIFGREFNMNLPKRLRKPLSHNSLRRIGRGIMKNSPEFRQFICHYYGGENANRSQSLIQPLNAVRTANCHQLITLEKLQFIADHCHTDQFQKSDLPIKTQTTRQTKQLISIEHFICQYYGGSNQSNGIDEPINTIPCTDRHQLIRLEKVQFIAKYMNCNKHPEYSHQGIDEPLSPVLTVNKHQLVTLFLDSLDIKARFLRADELAACSTFPRDYFKRPGLKVSGKNAVKMIGNAVPPLWAKIIMQHNLEAIRKYKNTA